MLTGLGLAVRNSKFVQKLKYPIKYSEYVEKYAEEFYPAEVFYINKKSEIASLKVEPVEKSKAKEAKNKDLEFKKNDLDR